MPEHDQFDTPEFQRRLAELDAARARARRILDVSEDASNADIRAAYRRLAKRQHPDHSPDDAEAHLRFLRLRAAYELLAHGRLSPLLVSDEDTTQNAETSEKYNTGSEWGHFLWWRERFFGE